MGAEPTPGGSVELRDYLAVLRRRLVLMVAVILLGAGVAAAWTLRRTPTQLLEHVRVDVPANSQILRVRYRDTVPLTAQRGADAFAARAYLAFREADARVKASQTSLLNDLARLNRQVAEAERSSTAPGPPQRPPSRPGPAELAQQPPPAAQRPAQRLPVLDFTPAR